MKLRQVKLASALFAIGMLPFAAQALTQTASMTVSASVTNSTATINSTPAPLAFGNINFSGGIFPISANTASSIGVTVTSGAPYTIEMDNGLWFLAGFRQVVTPATGGFGLNRTYMNYTLLQPDGVTPWGAGGAALASTGTGALQTFAINGSVTATGQEVTGSYSDTVTVTVVY